MLEKKTALGGGAKIAVTFHQEILGGLETKTVCPVQSPPKSASPTKEKYLLPSPSFKNLFIS